MNVITSTFDHFQNGYSENK